MSWGDGQYINYCLKVKNYIEKNSHMNINDIINKKWKYVAIHANILKCDFTKDIMNLLKSN